MSIQLENYKDDLRAERKDKEEARRKLAEVQLELETERTRLSVEVRMYVHCMYA